MGGRNGGNPRAGRGRRLEVVVGKVCGAHDRALGAGREVAPVKGHDDRLRAVLAFPDVVAAVNAHETPCPDIKNRLHTLRRDVFHSATLTASSCATVFASS